MIRQLPRIVIAGVNSGVGKSSIATGLMVALRRRGFVVQAFKIGPDYIDTSYHTFAAGRPSRNLDTFLLNKTKVKQLFTHHGTKADISVIEGVMGLFDGKNAHSDSGSTAEAAKLTKTPVLLVVDAQSMARSAAALVKGFIDFDPDLNLQGVILNRVGSESHAQILKDALSCLPVKVVGAIPQGALPKLTDRHLGLVPVVDDSMGKDIFDNLGSAVSKYLDLDLIMQLAEEAPLLKNVDALPPLPAAGKFSALRIGYAWDKAFCFYYRDALDLLEFLGAELVPFSPLRQTELPRDLDGIIFGGGFPEMHAEELSSNCSMLQSIRNFAQTGRPIYGECGGLMYLTEAVVDFEGRDYRQLGLIPARTIMQKRLQALGYYRGQTLSAGIIGPAGSKVKGHEFHYSILEPKPDTTLSPAVKLKKPDSNSWVKTEGCSHKNIYASYLHQHWCGTPEIAVNFLKSCGAAKTKNRKPD